MTVSIVNKSGTIYPFIFTRVKDYKLMLFSILGCLSYLLASFLRVEKILSINEIEKTNRLTCNMQMGMTLHSAIINTKCAAHN